MDARSLLSPTKTRPAAAIGLAGLAALSFANGFIRTFLSERAPPAPRTATVVVQPRVEQAIAWAPQAAAPAQPAQPRPRPRHPAPTPLPTPALQTATLSESEPPQAQPADQAAAPASAVEQQPSSAPEEPN